VQTLNLTVAIFVWHEKSQQNITHQPNRNIIAYYEISLPKRGSIVFTVFSPLPQKREDQRDNGTHNNTPPIHHRRCASKLQKYSNLEKVSKYTSLQRRALTL
jgi:hypothetical protein